MEGACFYAFQQSIMYWRNKSAFFCDLKNHTDIIRNTDLRTAMELVQEFEEGMQAEMNCSYSFLNIMSRDYIMVNEYFVKN